MMITHEEIANRIWESPDAVIELDKKISDILQEFGLDELQAGEESQSYLYVVKILLQEKINEDKKNDRNPRFVFSEESDNRLLSSTQLGRSQLFSSLADDIIKLITKCNTISRSKGSESIFRITDTFLLESTFIRRPCKSEDEFKRFIEACYKIFYEGAGERNLRIPNTMYIELDGDGQAIIENGREKTKDDFILFHIKRFRNSFSHDPEQMTDPDRSAELFRQTCMKYVEKPHIEDISTTEYLNLQEKLLRDIKGFLEDLNSIIQ